MARILHVNKHERREGVSRVLVDHHVDVAGSCREALRLLQSRGAYDLALVDLPLAPDDDTLGGELLELLRARYPDTRRIVVATLPPRGAVRAELLEKFGIDEVLIGSEIDVLDLRRLVEEALGDAESVDPRIRRAELRRRHQQWWRRQGGELDSRVRAAELVAHNAGKESGDRAQAALAEAVALRERFLADSADVADRIDQAVTVQQALDAAEALEHIEGLYAGLVGR